MSHINMAGMNGGNGVMAGVPMMNNGINGATPRPGGDQDDSEYEARLNGYIYDYFIRNESWECARALLNSNATMFPPLRRDGDVNGADDSAMATDSKDDLDTKRPDDLPPFPDFSAGQTSFLLEWFSLFWDVYHAQRKSNKASQQATQYVHHTQAQSRYRAEQQQALLQGGMRQVMQPNLNNQQMMRIQQAYDLQMNGDLRKNAMNNRGGFNPTSQQMAHMKQQQMLQNSMRRDPSDMDINGQRPRTPSSGDNAPSPSKRPRLEGAPFNGQMMSNGRGPLQGMQGQQMMDMSANHQANQLLVKNGINPEQLSPAQFASFQAQNPQIQEKSIQVYAQNLARNRGQGVPRPGMAGQDSPMMQPGFDMGAPGSVEMYNQQMMRAVPGGPNGTNGGNHALQDYQMQLMLLEQQNKKRLLMARQEQDNVGRDGQPMPGGPAGFAAGMSPSGSRSGPSPDPGQMKRGTPKMGPAGLPASPMPDNMPQRSSPAAMGFAGQMPPEMYQNGMTVPTNGMRMGPSSHPGQFGGQPFNNPAQAAQIEALRTQGRLPNGAGWQQGPQGQAPMMQPAQAPQPQPIGTPQQRSNDMPPPPTVQPGAGTNGRPSPTQPAAPPTPQSSNKANPKAKKDAKEPRKRPPKKGSVVREAPTPTGEAEAPPTPTPATPTIPVHPNSFNNVSKGEALAQPTVAPAPPAPAPAQGLPPPQPDISSLQQFDIGTNPDPQYRMDFGGLEGPDVLDNFDFDSFLQSNDEFADFDPSSLAAFGNPEGVETGAEGA